MPELKTKVQFPSEKLPPQNIEAEQSVLGSLMLDKEAIIRIADILEPNDFYRNTHAIIYQIMVELYEKNEPIDLLSLTSRLEDKKKLEEIGGNSYLTSLVNMVPTAAHIVHYAKIVKQKKTLRDLIESAYQISEASYQEPDDVENLVDEAEQKIFNISQKSVGQKFIPIKEGLEEAFERIDKLHKGDGSLRGVPTGFVDLDNYLSGLQKSDLVILAARPSLGKTTLALDFARHVAVKEKMPVGIFSIEMSKEQLVDRLICSQAEVDLYRMRTGHLKSEGIDNDFERIQRSMDILSDAPIFIDDTPSPSVLHMRTMARRMQAEHNLGLIVIDYLQLIQARNTFDSSVQQVTEISRNLKALARELNVPVLALSQLSRAVESRSPAIPKLSDLRESGCLTGDSLIISAKTGERIPIRKLAQRKIQKPIKVLSLDDRYQLTPHWMSKVFYSGKKMVFELKTKSGRIIKASSNHPFFKLEGWTKLENLKKGDSIALPRKINIQTANSPISKDELILLAHLLGDGCILPNQPFHYTSADKENIKTVKRTAKKLFNIKGRTLKQENWYHIYLKSPYHTTHKKYHPITNWFNELGIKRVHSWKKQISEKVFQCNSNDIALFLKHLWSTDGNLSWKYLKGRKPTGNVYYATSSKILAEQVQHLLLRLNIQSSVRKNRNKKGYRIMYHISIEGSQNQLKFLTKVGIAGNRKKILPAMINKLKEIVPNPNIDVIPKEAWRSFIQEAKERLNMSWRAFSQGIETSYCGTTLFKHGISRERMMRINNLVNDQTISDLANSDIYWDKIVSIRKIGVRNVYDATVENDHNFIANDIIVHNSLEQDSDVVLFIYREDRDRPNSDKKNIADIIIAKHRNGPTGKIELYFNESQVSFKNLEKHRFEESIDVP